MAEVANDNYLKKLRSLQKQVSQNQNDIRSTNSRLTSLTNMDDKVNTRINDLNNNAAHNYTELSKQISNLSNRVNDKFDQMNGKFDQVNSKFDRVNDRFDQVNDRFNSSLRWQIGTIIGVTISSITGIASVIISILAGLGKL